MKKIRMILLILVSGIIFVAGTCGAAPFSSHAIVEQNFNSSWVESTLSGTARYFLYVDDFDVSVNELSIEFESDIFDLAELDAADFSVFNPTGWNTTK